MKIRRKSKEKSTEGLINDCDSVVFSSYAYEKLSFLHNNYDHEVGGFGIASDPKDPLYIDDVYITGQTSGPVSVEWSDKDLADFYTEMSKQGLQPYQFSRLWCHTHPDFAPFPSNVDVNTFDSTTFTDCSWALMIIMGKDNETYAEFKNNDLKFQHKIDVVLDDYGDLDQIDDETYDYWEHQVENAVRIEKSRSRPISYLQYGRNYENIDFPTRPNKIIDKFDVSETVNYFLS